MVHFRMKLAGYVVEVSALFESTPVYCEDFLTEEAPDFAICVSEADLPAEQERLYQEAREEGLRPRVFKDPFLERSVIQQKVAEALLDYSAIDMHGSVVAVDGYAFLFTAKCGTGKSTHTRLWRQLLGDRAVILNDDKPILRIEKDHVLACGSPWMGKHGIGANLTLPLKGICILERGKENSIMPISGQEAMPMLLRQGNVPQIEENIPRYHALINKIAELVPFFKMQCNISADAAKMAYEAMAATDIRNLGNEKQEGML